MGLVPSGAKRCGEILRPAGRGLIVGEGPGTATPTEVKCAPRNRRSGGRLCRRTGAARARPRAIAGDALDAVEHQFERRNLDAVAAVVLGTIKRMVRLRQQCGEIEHGVVAITKSDLADPRPAAAEVAELLPMAPAVPVSARTGTGLKELLAALDRTVKTIPGRARRAAPDGAFPRLHGMSIWEWFSKHPEEEQLFAGGMRWVTEEIAPESSPLSSPLGFAVS